MHTPIERLIHRLSADERMVILVGALIIAAMLSAIALDRLLAARTTPTMITLAAPPAATAELPRANRYALNTER
jgi:hypothetical protein